MFQTRINNIYVTETDIAFANHKSHCARVRSFKRNACDKFSYAIFNFNLIILLIINNKLKLFFKKKDKLSNKCIYIFYFL